MKKTDFDACLCPSFLFCYSYDALYTPIGMSLMYVSSSFVADKENRGLALFKYILSFRILHL